MGDWDYYITQMRMQDVAQKVSVAQEIHESPTLNDLIQRRLSSRAKTISDYLTAQQQRFFNAFVIGIYGGAPQWFELDVRSSPYFDADEMLPDHVERALGFLELRGNEKLFAIDGQHRVVGIRNAVTREPELGNEHVAALFVGHRTSEAGLQRTRRLFTTLNRYAKPVSKLDKIALDEDDVVAIIVRFLVESHPLFKSKVALASGNSLPPNDQHNFTTIGALYDAMDIVLRNRNKSNWEKYKRLRPSIEDITQYQDAANSFWDHLSSTFPEVESFASLPATVAAAREYREQSVGGHVLFRPVGLLIYSRTIRKLCDANVSLSDAIDLTSKAPSRLSEQPWEGLIWDSTNQRMLTSAENQKVAERLLFYSLGGELSRYRTSETKLRTELAGILRINDSSEVTLPKYVDGRAGL